LPLCFSEAVLPAVAIIHWLLIYTEAAIVKSYGSAADFFVNLDIKKK